MNRAQITSSAFVAGMVARYHTWPVHHQQSVGEHTHQVMVIYWLIFGPMTPEVSTAILWHDMGEMATGDLPFPVKSRHPELKAICDELEQSGVGAMGGPLDLSLSNQEKCRIKVADLLEMATFGQHEVRMGNTYAQPIVDDTLRAVAGLLPNLPAEDQERVEAYVRAAGL